MVRDNRVTYTKAVGIILMVLAHSNGLLFVEKTIALFHMPLFFIMSGYCLKEKYFTMPFRYVVRKTRNLWWLYVKYSIIFILIHNLFYYVHIYDASFWQQKYYNSGDITEGILNVLTHMQCNELLLRQFWFVKTLFLSSIGAFVILLLVENIITYTHRMQYSKAIYICVILVLGGAIICLNNLHKTFTILYISPREFLAILFIVVGYSFSKFSIKRFSKVLIFLSIVVLCVNIPVNNIRMKSDFYETNEILPYCLTAILVTWSVYSIPWYKFTGNISKYLLYIGNNTLPILIWHFLAFKLVSLAIIICYGLPFYELGAFHVIYIYADQGWFIIYTLVGIFIPLLTSYYLNNLKKYAIK